MSILASLGSAGSWLLNGAQSLGSSALSAYNGINSGVTSVLNGVGSFGGENFAPIASGVFSLINGIRQNRINEKVYHLNKYMALHGVEVRQRDLKRAGINPILAGYSPAQGGIASPQYSDAVGTGLNNAMALKEAKLKIKGAKEELKQMQLQNLAQELQNENQTFFNRYQKGEYDEILNHPYRLALDDLYSGYRNFDQIVADFARDVKFGVLSKKTAEHYIDMLHRNMSRDRFGSTINKDYSKVPLSIRRQFDIDNMQVEALQQYNKTQYLENFLRTYNNSVLPPPGSARAANTAAPWVSIGSDVINSALQLTPKGAVANELSKGLFGNNNNNNKKGGKK